jgi:hypothetical protein
MADLTPTRRILTANLPLSSSSSEDGAIQPAVAVYSESITSPDIGEAHQLGASCKNTTIFSHAQVPTSNDGLYVDVLTSYEILQRAEVYS